MAEADSTIVIGIELDDGSIKKATVDAKQLGDALGATISKGVGAGVDKSFTGIAVQLEFFGKIASTAFRAISAPLNQAIDEAIGAEKALALFNASLANAGKFSQQASNEFAAFASELQKVGVVGDDAIIGAAQSLVSIGGLTGKALQDATKSSLDFAAGLQIDVGTAFDLVAKAAAGNTSALSRYGIKIDESIPKSERFAATLEQINQRFGGLNAASANTFGGAVTQLQNNIGDFLQSLGEFITKSPAITAVIKTISTTVGNLAESLTKFRGGGDFFKPLITDVLTLAATLSKTLVPTFELVLNTGLFLINSLKTGFATIATGASAITTTFAAIGNAVGLVSDEKLAEYNKRLTDNADATATFAQQTRDSFSSITESFNISFAVDSFVAELQRAVDQSAPVQEQLKNNFNAARTVVDANFKIIEARAKQFGQLVSNGLSNAISQGVQVVITNLAKGKNAFEGFFKVVLGIIGDLVIQLGTTLIGIGIGIEALRASIVTLAGGQAIAAGIALVALGALLKSLSSGGGEATAPTQTVGTGPGGTPEIPGTATQPDLARPRGTEVAINIQGNVLDRRETGLEIASVLQEFFDTNDGVLART